MSKLIYHQLIISFKINKLIKVNVYLLKMPVNWSSVTLFFNFKLL